MGPPSALPLAETMHALPQAVMLTAGAVAISIWNGGIADLQGPPGHLCGATILGAAVTLCLRGRYKRGALPYWIGLAVFVAVAVILMIPRVGPWLALAAAAAALSIPSSGQRQSDRRIDTVRIATSLLVFAGMHFALSLLMQRSTLAWQAAESVAQAVSLITTSSHIAHVSFGPSQLLLPSVATLVLPVLILAPRDKRYLKIVLATLALALLGLMITAAVASHLTLHPHRTTVKVLSGTLVFQAVALSLWSLLGFFTYRTLLPSLPCVRSEVRHRTFAPLLACILPIAVITSGWYGEAARPGRVLVYRDNPGDFRVPDMKTWGKQATGRFGLLCDYLRSLGYHSAYTAPGRLAADLRNASAIILPQPSKRLGAEDLKLLRSFIARGGGLLYLVDHTNVGQCMIPANDVLAPYGILPKFDTALPAKTGWAADLAARDHPVLRNLDIERCETGWWVGGSLAVRGGAQPLLIGTRCWSDWGNMRNAKRAYLGNYRIDRRERVGDLVLAAAGNTRGRGRVIAFGDTSTPQNLAVAQSWRFVGQTMSWLTARPASRVWSGVRALGLAALLVGSLALTLLQQKPQTLGILFVVTMASAFFPQGFRPAIRPPLPGRQIVLVYAPPLARVSLESMKEDGLWGALLAVARAGRLPRIVDKLDAAALRQSRHLLMLSPGAALSKGERSLLTDWVNEGGQLTLTCAPEDWPSFSRLPILSGVQVTFRSLGNGRATDVARQERYSCMAYALTADESLWRPILFRLGDCFGAMSVRGRGRVVLIADPSFVTCRNTEGEKMEHQENCRWLASLYYAPPRPRDRTNRNASSALKLPQHPAGITAPPVAAQKRKTPR